MLIVSKFKDFYDSAQSAGVDKTTTLIRETEMVEDIPNLPFRSLFITTVKTKDGREREFWLEWIYFCGKVYPVLQSCYTGLHESYSTVYKSIEDMELDIPLGSNYYTAPSTLLFRFSGIGRSKLKSELDRNRTVPVELFSSIQAVYFRVPRSGTRHVFNRTTHYTVEKYPVLSKYTPALNMNAYTAFQEIEMFLSGILGAPEKPIIEVSDISKRDSKGFDKFSFRNRGKKK